MCADLARLHADHRELSLHRDKQNIGGAVGERPSLARLQAAYKQQQVSGAVVRYNDGILTIQSRSASSM